MDNESILIANRCFEWFVNKHGFHLGEVVSEDQTFWVLFTSDIFGIRLERYRHAFCATLHKTGHEDKEIDLFNLVAFVASPLSKTPESFFFTDEPNLTTRYEKQLTYYANTIDEYYGVIVGFFSSDDYSAKLAELRNFVIRRYPEVFKTNERCNRPN